MEGILTMSHKELDRLQIIEQIVTKELRVEEGAELIGISRYALLQLPQVLL